MNGLDIAVVAVIVISALFALARGFVREVLSVVSWVGAAAITIYGYEYAVHIAAGYFKTELLRQFVAGAGLFLTSLIVLTVLTSVIARRVRSTSLSPVDRTLGLVFGLARGLVIVSIAYMLVAISVPRTDFPTWVKEAKSTPYLDRGAQMLRDLLPPSLKRKTAALATHARAIVGVPAPMVGGTNPARQVTVIPPPAAPTAPAAPTYSHNEQQEMKRVIEDNGR